MHLSAFVFHMVGADFLKMFAARFARRFSSLVVRPSQTAVVGAGSGVPQDELKGREAVIFQRAKNAMTSGATCFVSGFFWLCVCMSVRVCLCVS
jgi:hypothetical protein